MFVLLSLLLTYSNKDHAVSLNAKVPWYGSTLFDQVFSGLAEFSTEKAEEFLLTVHEKGIYSNSTAINEELLNIVDASTAALIRTQVEQNAYLPRIEYFRDIARSVGGSNFDNVIIVGERPKFEVPEKAPFFFREDIEIRNYDFRIGSFNSIIYANLSDPSTFSFIAELVRSKKEFVLRPTSQTLFGVSLRGYGIELRPFKYSMEYKVKDSASEKGKQQKVDVQDNTLNIFENKAPENDDETDDFFSRCVGFIKSRETELPETLSSLSANVPLLMSSIGNKYKNMEKLKEQHIANNKNKEQKLINGRVLSENETDIFTLFDIIKKEKNLKNIIKSNSKLGSDFFTSKIPNRNNYRLNWTSDFISYANNIEHDKLYKNWPENVKEYIKMKDTLPKAKKNILNIVTYTNPVRVYGVSDMLTLSSMMKYGIPARIGVYPVFDLSKPLDRHVAFAFHYIAMHSPVSSFNFLVRSAYFVGYDQKTLYINKPTAEAYAKAYQASIRGIKDALSWNDIYKLYSPFSDVFKRVSTAQKHFVELGIDTASMSINGNIIPSGIPYQYIQGQVFKEAFELSSFLSRYRETTDIDFDLFGLYENEYFFVDSLKSPLISANINSIKIYGQNEVVQQFYINFLKKTFISNQVSKEFCIFFSKDEEKGKKISEFMKINSVSYAINPEIDNKLKEKLGIRDESIIINGFLINNSTTDEEILSTYLKISRLLVIKAFNNSCFKSEIINNTVLYYISSVYAQWQSEDIKRGMIETANDTDLFFSSSRSNEFSFDIKLNPFTQESQQLIPIVNYLYKNSVVNVTCWVLLPNNSDKLPQSFYRTALDENECIFGYLNNSIIYSALPAMPNTWVTESMYADIDLDNILCSELTEGVHRGTYVLTNIIAEGFTNANGARIYLSNDYNEIIGGTTIMSNGYWQIQANPGHFSITLGSEASAYFSVLRGDVIIDSFAMTKASVDIKQESEIRYSYKSTNNTDRVDIFSVASGHLYERLMKIMMLSARKRSKYNVKFWILKNFLSPTFKASLPSMSQKYNFTYELISYKWPKWLMKQTEKQRIIWGNKILFLDVLFPPELDRVIYVDSDQIIRTDLIELMRMDFQGAPYAFTPMCNSRKETEPFRFWKKGYWNSHLNGKPYHISALFAIDLQKFRSMGAGNVLRKHYQRLSSDPDSLANLDQDLPNDLQDEIPIFSLPQEWLWCETWCSDETMDQAKTIDLCNNPLTHAPKLEIAKTRVEEWPGLDKEAKELTANQEEYQHIFF